MNEQQPNDLDLEQRVRNIEIAIDYLMAVGRVYAATDPVVADAIAEVRLCGCECAEKRRAEQQAGSGPRQSYGRTHAPPIVQRSPLPPLQAQQRPTSLASHPLGQQQSLMAANQSRQLQSPRSQASPVTPDSMFGDVGPVPRLSQDVAKRAGERLSEVMEAAKKVRDLRDKADQLVDAGAPEVEVYAAIEAADKAEAEATALALRARDEFNAPA
jgi:hypothetical protein